MSNKNLFKEAIADAKAVREAALANAKAALEEALTPKLQSMLATKLQEMNYDQAVDDAEEAEAEMEEGMYPEDTSDEIQDRYRATGAALEEDELEEDFDLSEILAELEEEDEKSLKEAKEEDEEEESEEKSKEENVADMSVEDLKALIKDIVSQEIEAEEAEGPEAEAEEEAGEESMSISGEEESDEINLDELLAELDALGEGEDMEEESMYEAKKSKHEKGETKAQEKAEHAKKEKKEKEEMKEAIDTINTLRAELNEVNLLNAKLLYVNKIFKAKNLSESQKLKVIASFDKATTAKEAKVVFESLNATLTTAAPKQAIKESIGFASRAAGTAPRKAIVETNDAITRMQKLANIIK
jgi:hypothetical protein